uniref:Uncharacterized protein n=1 Tax=Oncorhynchus kisutch TaxID=8019 RepID=A0A8C7IVP3_ONCKI
PCVCMCVCFHPNLYKANRDYMGGFISVCINSQCGGSETMHLSHSYIRLPLKGIAYHTRFSPNLKSWDTTLGLA